MNRYLKGFTLLEFIISFALSAMIFSGITKIYLSLLKNKRHVQSMADLQHRSQMAFFILKKNIQSAGESNCLKIKKNQNTNSVKLTSTTTISKKTNTDILHIQRCLFIANRMQWANIIFYIRNTHRKNLNNFPVISLYRKIGHNPSEELVTGISDMTVCYITRWQNSPLKCLKANDIQNVKNIKGIHIRLVLDPMIQTKEMKNQIAHNLLFITAALKNQHASE